jgi:hypothetical protein
MSGGFTGWVDDRIAKAVPLIVGAVMARLEARLDIGIGEIKDDIMRIDNKLVDMSSRMIGQVDALDGQMGNLQQQLTDIPGQIIKSVEQALQGFNPFRPLA